MEEQVTLQMQEKAKTIIRNIFIIRAVLWVVALASTIYWIFVSFDLYHKGIFDPYEYATILRPILYTCLIIAIVAIVLCFVLRGVAKEIKRQNGLR